MRPPAETTPAGSTRVPAAVRGVDRCPPEPRTAIYDAHLQRRPVEVDAEPHGTTIGDVVEITDDTFIVQTRTGGVVVDWVAVAQARLS